MALPLCLLVLSFCTSQKMDLCASKLCFVFMLLQNLAFAINFLVFAKSKCQIISIDT